MKKNLFLYCANLAYSNIDIKNNAKENALIGCESGNNINTIKNKMVNCNTSLFLGNIDVLTKRYKNRGNKKGVNEVGANVVGVLKRINPAKVTIIAYPLLCRIILEERYRKVMNKA